MKILVTGGAGFIGSHVVEHYINLGYEVFVIDNLVTGNRENLLFLNPANFFEIDINDFDSVSNIIKKYEFDIIVHLAAVVSVVDTINNPLYSNEININATLNLLEVTRKYNNNIKRFIFASSAAVYGNNASLPNNIKTLVSPVSPYAIQKYSSEQYVKQYSDLYNVPTTSLRFFNVYGPRQNPKSTYSGVLSIMQNSYVNNRQFTFFGDGKQTRDFVYVKDVVQAIDIVGKTNESIGNIYNVGTGKANTLSEVFNFFAEIHNKDIPKMFVDEREGDIKHSYSDIKELARLGYSPKYDIRQGLRSYISNANKNEIGV